MKMDGLEFLSRLPGSAIPVAFFDPQYRGVLDKLGYGNEGQSRGKARSQLQQMAPDTIGTFLAGIDRVLMASGHLFLWMDKFHLCSGFADWLAGTQLQAVDMLTWEKGRLGMGYRTRRVSEHLVVLQKRPTRAKGVWKTHTIADVC
ncbi:MAG: site-specific DNA-methyltransferase, partial [Betaproteobacteria bacterium]|nr:site-specific DNA-methyltransferase [Betaproteobacteria bacterium]